MLVAVYGTLRKGEVNSPLLSNANYKGKFNSEPVYIMKSLAGDGFPGIKLEGKTSIVFEVYKVTREIVTALDGLENYKGKDCKDNLYNRAYIHTPFGPALTYYYNKNFKVTEKLIENGDWTDYISTLPHKNLSC